MIPLTDDQRFELFKQFEQDLHLNTADRQEFDTKRLKLYNAYRNRVRKRAQPFRGCSNTSVPIVTRAVDRMVIHALQTIAPEGSFKSMSAVPVSSHPMALERAEDTSEYMRYNFVNKMQIMDPLERFIRNLFLYGNSFGIVWWRRVLRNTRTIERFPLFREESIENEDGQNETRRVKISMRAVLEDFFSVYEQVRGLRPNGQGSFGQKYSITIWDEADRREKTFNIEAYEDADAREIVCSFDSKETIINRPQFDNIEMDDIYFPYNVSCIQDASHIAIRREKSWTEIQAGVKSGKWNLLTKDDLDEMEKYITGKAIKEGITELETLPRTTIDGDHRMRDLQDRAEGADSHRTYPFEVWEEFRRLDLNHDGEEEDYVVWYEARTKKVMRIEYLHSEYHMHERPIVHAGLIPIGNRILHVGVGEILFPLVTELNTVFNHRNDAATMAISPGGFFRPGSGFDPGDFNWRPNMWIPVDNPGTDVREYVGVSQPRDAVNVEQFLLAMAEDLSVSTFTMGRGPDRANAPRTARGTLAIIQQDAIKLNYLLQRLAPVLSDIAHKTLSVLRANAPDREEFRVTGKDRLRTIGRKDLNNKYDFYWELETVSANKEIRRQFAAMAMEATLPISQMPPEAISQGTRILVRNFLEALDFKNADQIIPDAPGFDRAPMTQEDEIVAMIQGIPVEPIMGDNHEEHIAIMDAFEISEGFGSVTKEWVESVWKPHKQAHLRFRRIIEQQIQAQGGGGRTAGPGAFGNFVGQGQLAGGGEGGFGLSEGAAEQLGSTFSGGGY